MNECTYLGRICTDLVLNKKAMDDKENYWTRFRLAIARKRVKKEKKYPNSQKLSTKYTQKHTGERNKKFGEED